ncbi:MAG TPA: M48 family metalloprotease [Candidatus Eisenbacteria bacterium]|nr:M48 family metalloprotease [Candidatus Eisenbacteria bacterium]
MKLSLRFKGALACVMVAGAFIWSCATGLVPATGERRYLGFSWEQEQEIGKQASKEIAATFGLYHDPKLESYVKRVGDRVLQESHLRRESIDPEFRRTPVTFQVLDSPTVNAMAIPGGHIYVTRGLLAHLTSEDQLAMVLGHELGHVTARHAARQAWQQQIGQGLLLGGAVLGQVLGLSADQILGLGGTAAQLIFLRHSREDELEADKLGVEYSARAGYDPLQIAGFFRALARMTEKEGAALPSFLMTHPNPGDRIQRIKELSGVARRLQPEHADGSRYFQAIEGVVFGEDPRQGFVEEGVFYHPELRFRFPVPQGFRIINQPTQVVMLENQKRAAIGFRLAGEKSAESAAARFAAQPGVRVLESARTRSMNLPAAMVVADARPTNNQVVRVIAYFVEYGGRTYHFIAYTSPQLFGGFRNEFLATMRGFGELTDPEVLRRQPIRLRVERANRTAAFRELVPAKLPKGVTAEELAILNQVGLADEIRAGTLIKLPAAP